MAQKMQIVCVHVYPVGKVLIAQLKIALAQHVSTAVHLMQTVYVNVHQTGWVQNVRLVIVQMPAVLMAAHLMLTVHANVLVVGQELNVKYHQFIQILLVHMLLKHPANRYMFEQPVEPLMVIHKHWIRVPDFQRRVNGVFDKLLENLIHIVLNLLIMNCIYVVLVVIRHGWLVQAG
jgi:hypothetical protein